jgi:hypothetical protein
VLSFLALNHFGIDTLSTPVLAALTLHRSLLKCHTVLQAAALEMEGLQLQLRRYQRQQLQRARRAHYLAQQPPLYPAAAQHCSGCPRCTSDVVQLLLQLLSSLKLTPAMATQLLDCGLLGTFAYTLMLTYMCTLYLRNTLFIHRKLAVSLCAVLREIVSAEAIAAKICTMHYLHSMYYALFT